MRRERYANQTFTINVVITTVTAQAIYSQTLLLKPGIPPAGQPMQVPIFWRAGTGFDVCGNYNSFIDATD